jgi:hypothetical protein
MLSSFHKAELFLIPRQNKVRAWKEPMEPFRLNVHLVAHPVGFVGACTAKSSPIVYIGPPFISREPIRCVERLSIGSGPGPMERGEDIPKLATDEGPGSQPSPMFLIGPPGWEDDNLSSGAAELPSVH